MAWQPLVVRPLVDRTRALIPAAALLSAGMALFGAGTAHAQNNPSFNLVNQSRQTIERAYASPSGVTNWGRDQLGDDRLEPGQRFAVRLPAGNNCLYDIRVEYANGTSDERRNVNTCTITDVAFPSGATAGQPNRAGGQQSRDPSFRVLNQGQTEVNSVYATVTGVRSWGQDRLGNNTIPAGGNRIIRLPAGQCMYDVRVVFTDGQAIEKRNVDLCQVTDFPVH